MRWFEMLAAMALLAAVVSCGSDSSGPDISLIDEIQFVEIPSGSYQMGAPLEEEGSTAIERPVHTVTIDYTFEVMATEVTQGIWEQVMGSNPVTVDFQGSDYPVFNVSWADCQDFCAALEQLDPEHTYRLPSEAEWEYFCRAGTTTPFFWGTNWLLGENFAWFQGYSSGEPHPVGGLVDNAWGLHDVCGNVFEWCQDTWHGSYEGAPAEGSAWLGGQSGDRIIRGGCFDSEYETCRSAFREPSDENAGSERIGLRLVRVPN